MIALPAEVQIVALRRAQRNEPAFPSLVVAESDVLLMVGPTKEVLDRAAKAVGAPAPGRLLTDRSEFDYLRVFASRPAVVGKTLADLELPGTQASLVLHVRRGDTDLLSRQTCSRVWRPHRPDPTAPIFALLFSATRSKAPQK
jgi:putative transport protein